MGFHKRVPVKVKNKTTWASNGLPQGEARWKPKVKQ